MKDIVIYGKGDFARLVLHYLQLDNRYRVVCFCVDKDFHDGDSYLGYPLYNIDDYSTVEDFEKAIKSNGLDAFLAVGYTSLLTRNRMFEKIRSKGFNLINIVCDGVVIDKTAKVGVNNIFLQNVIVQPFSTIKDNNYFGSRCTICHDSFIGNNNYFAPNAIIAGFSSVGNNNFLGIGSVVSDNVTLADNCILGASSTLLSDALQEGKYFGIPAKLYNKEK